MCLWNTTPVDTKSDWIFLLAAIQATTVVGFFCTPKMVQRLQNNKVRQSIRGKGGHLYLQINMKNTNLDFKYILNLCQVSLKFIQWLHRS